MRSLNRSLAPENNTELLYIEKGMKTFKVKRRWITLMTAMTLIAVSGLAVGEHIKEKERVKSEQ